LIGYFSVGGAVGSVEVIEVLPFAELGFEIDVVFI
jgi:hypothetical protein